MKNMLFFKSQDPDYFKTLIKQFKKIGITYKYALCGEQKIYDKYTVGYWYYYAVFYKRKTKEVLNKINKIKNNCKANPTKNDLRINHEKYNYE